MSPHTHTRRRFSVQRPRRECRDALLGSHQKTGWLEDVLDIHGCCIHSMHHQHQPLHLACLHHGKSSSSCCVFCAFSCAVFCALLSVFCGPDYPYPYRHPQDNEGGWCMGGGPGVVLPWSHPTTTPLFDDDLATTARLRRQQQQPLQQQRR